MPTPNRDRLEQALIKISQPSAANVYTSVYEQAARTAADASDARLSAGTKIGPLDGVIVSVKESFSIAFEDTMYGATFPLYETPTVDPMEITRLREAGAIIIGKTSMTEFGIDSMGIKARSIPLNPFDPSRVPGGSTSGGAVAVALDLCDVALGSDTFGSIRVPAAWNDLVGFVATAGRFPRYSFRQGLSLSFGSIGPIAKTVMSVADTDAVMADIHASLTIPAVNTLRVGVARGIPFMNLISEISAQFEGALTRISAAGASVQDTSIDQFFDNETSAAASAILAAESSYCQLPSIKDRPQDYLPSVRDSLLRGFNVPATVFIDSQRIRMQKKQAMHLMFETYDVLVVPTVRFFAPVMQPMLSNDQLYRSLNNASQLPCSVTAICSLPAINIPLPGLPSPAGFMLIGKTGSDRNLLGIAAALENKIRNL